MEEEDLSYFKNEEFKHNLAQYEAMQNGGPSVYLEADELTDIAEYYLSKNKPKEANKCIDYALSLFPHSTDPLVFKARQNIFQGMIEEAEQFYQLIEDKNDREAIFLQAEIMLEKGTTDEAIAYLHDKRSYFSDDKTELYEYIYDCAELLYDFRRNSEAIKLIDEAEKVNKLTENLVLLRVHILGSMSKMPEATILLEETLKEHPYWKECWDALADMYYMRDMHEEALEASDFSLAIKEHGNAHALLTKANSLYSMDNYEKAHKVFLQYIEEFPLDSEQPYLHDGICLVRMEKFEEACKQLEIAQKLSNDMSFEQLQIYVQLAYTYSKLKKLEQAIIFLDKAKDYNPDKFKYDVLKGHAYLECGEEKKAEEMFKAAIKQDPTDEQTKFLIGTSYFESMYYDKAMKYFEELYPSCQEETQCTILPYMAFSCYALKDAAGYLKYLEKSCKQNPEGTKVVLGHLFPDSLAPNEYFEYQKKQSPL